MGLTGGRLVKSVFSRSRSAASHDSHVNGRHGGGGMQRRRWGSSVRSYLCGDEFNSVVAEEDSASIKSSEVVTVLLQPPNLISGLTGEEDEKNSNSNCMFDEEDHVAAIVIQSAFRRFQARRRRVEEKDEEVVGLGLGGGISPSRAEGSIGTSIEVQTAKSVKALSVVDETVVVGNHRAQQQQQLRSRTQQLLRTKEDWDDSTVSSNISKMRVQHRLEAMTRRERALAYAFSQQLRICSKKRRVQLQSAETGGADMGWTWLERWMATRVPKDTQPCGRLVLGKTLVDLALAVDKESSGSNSVSVHSIADDTENNTNNITIPTNPLRRKSVTKSQCHRLHAQISKKDSTKEAVMDMKRNKQKQQEINEQNQCPDDTESEYSITAPSKLLG